MWYPHIYIYLYLYFSVSRYDRLCERKAYVIYEQYNTTAQAYQQRPHRINPNMYRLCCSFLHATTLSQSLSLRFARSSDSSNSYIDVTAVRALLCRIFDVAVVVDVDAEKRELGEYHGSACVRAEPGRGEGGGGGEGGRGWGWRRHEQPSFLASFTLNCLTRSYRGLFVTAPSLRHIDTFAHVTRWLLLAFHWMSKRKPALLVPICVSVSAASFNCFAFLASLACLFLQLLSRNDQN